VQKGLCIAALTISVIVFLLFLADLILYFLLGNRDLAPFKGANLPVDIVFVVCSLVLALLSWFTYREQV
jgi:hypothetical protein